MSGEGEYCILRIGAVSKPVKKGFPFKIHQRKKGKRFRLGQFPVEGGAGKEAVADMLVHERECRINSRGILNNERVPVMEQ